MRRHPTNFWWHRRPRLYPFALIILALSFAPLTSAQAATVYVDWALGNNSYDGLSNVVANGHGPMRNIVNAIAAASNGASIVIAPGYYAEFTWDPGANILTLLPQGQVNICADDLCNIDSIGDGIPDWWREQYFGSPNTTNSSSCATCDPDGDGLNNLQEYQQGTNPNSSDTDGDGLPDSVDADPLHYDHSTPTFTVTYPNNATTIYP